MPQLREFLERYGAARETLDDLAELERDRVRLDWMIQHGASVRISGKSYYCEWVLPESKYTLLYDTPRTAIDAAIQATKEVKPDENSS